MPITLAAQSGNIAVCRELLLHQAEGQVKAASKVRETDSFISTRNTIKLTLRKSQSKDKRVKSTGFAL